MITVPLKDIVNSVEGLRALLAIKLPIKISYRISKLVKNGIDRELKTYEEERHKLVLEYGEKQEDGSTTVKDQTKMKDFAADIQELLDTEVQLDFDPISIDELGDTKIEPQNIVPFIFQ